MVRAVPRLLVAIVTTWLLLPGQAHAECYETQYGTRCEDGEITNSGVIGGLLITGALIAFGLWDDQQRKRIRAERDAQQRAEWERERAPEAALARAQAQQRAEEAAQAQSRASEAAQAQAQAQQRVAQAQAQKRASEAVRAEAQAQAQAQKRASEAARAEAQAQAQAQKRASEAARAEAQAQAQAQKRASEAAQAHTRASQVARQVPCTGLRSFDQVLIEGERVGVVRVVQLGGDTVAVTAGDGRRWTLRGAVLAWKA
jgi:hypothetical protein